MTEPSTAFSRPQRATLIVTCVGTFMTLLDVSIVNTALPSIQRGLHESFSQLQWVIDAYSLAFAVLLLSAGALADRHGRKRLFQVGMAVFALGSLLCGLATSAGELEAARGPPPRPPRLAPARPPLPRPPPADQGGGDLGRDQRPRPRDRPHGRRRAGNRRRLAVGVLRQRADRRRLPGLRGQGAGGVRQPRRPPPRPARPADLGRVEGRADLRVRGAWELPLERGPGVGPADDRRPGAHLVPAGRGSFPGADAAAGAVQGPAVLGHGRGDVPAWLRAHLGAVLHGPVLPGRPASVGAAGRAADAGLQPHVPPRVPRVRPAQRPVRVPPPGRARRARLWRRPAAPDRPGCRRQLP